jgi:hypothetical protein
VLGEKETSVSISNLGFASVIEKPTLGFVFFPQPLGLKLLFPLILSYSINRRSNDALLFTK